VTDVPTVPLPSGVLLMDGGMGQELARHGADNSAPLWSARALIDNPDLVLRVHRDYLAAGAKLLLTNTYASTRVRLETAGMIDRLVELNVLACDLARRARDEAGAAGADVLIAGSLPPMHGSYSADAVQPFAEIEPMFREQAEILAPHVDLFICETMSTAEEGRAGATGTCSAGKPVWVSWTLVDDGRPLLRSGETIAQAHAAIADLPVSGFLANCSAPESISTAMPEIVGVSDFPVGGYANGFNPVPKDWVSGVEAGPASLTETVGIREDITPDAYADIAQTWIDAGARLIGGCCHIGPDHIGRLAERLN